LFACYGSDERLPVLDTPGVRHIVGDGSSQLALGDREMHALAFCGQCECLLPHPFMPAADSMRIARGPLQGLKGQVEKDGCDLLFVVSIQVIQRSFAIRVQANDLEFGG
jgi:transcription antitermination factor NusG